MGYKGNSRLSIHQRNSLWDTIDKADDWFDVTYGNTNENGEPSFIAFEINFQGTEITLFFNSQGDRFTAQQEFDFFATELIDELKRRSLLALNH